MIDEVYSVLGVRPYSFKDDKTGKLIEGATLHVVNSSPDDEDVTGSIVERLSLSKPVMEDLARKCGGIAGVVGLSITPVYNKRGKIREVLLHEEQ